MLTPRGSSFNFGLSRFLFDVLSTPISGKYFKSFNINFIYIFRKNNFLYRYTRSLKKYSKITAILMLLKKR